MFRLWPLYLLFFVFCPTFSGWSQSTVNGRVLDASTGAPLPFATIGILDTRLGSIANQEGVFRIRGSNMNDTLTIKHLGYKTRRIPVDQVVLDYDILLQPKAVQIMPFTVYADGDELYNWIVKCRKKLKTSDPQQCRAFMELHTFVGEYPAEIIEMYYNAGIESGSLQTLAYKSGRQSLAEIDNSYFMNLSTSKAFQIFNLTFPDRYMPVNPLALTKRKLKKTYEVSRLSADSDPHLHLAFRPKVDDVVGFSGEIWVSKAHELPLEVKLRIDQTKVHPFVPAFQADSLSDVSIEIAQRFEVINRQPVPELLRFAYDLTSHRSLPPHLNPEGTKTLKSKRVHTDGIMYYYRYGEPFVLPFFDFDNHFNDYQKIQNTPHNELFWEHSSVLVKSERYNKSAGFFKNHGIFRGNIAPGYGPFLEKANFLWSDTSRIQFATDQVNKSKKGLPANRPVPLRFQYNIAVKLYLDLVETDSGLQFYSATVLDVFETFYDMEVDLYTNPFLNIYFDLAEIQRRKMNYELKTISVLNTRKAQALYNKHTYMLKEILTEYERATRSGKKHDALSEWNDYVHDELGIDNFMLFQLKPEESGILRK